MANYWHQANGTPGATATAAPFADFIGTAPVYAVPGWGGGGQSFSGVSATGASFNSVRRLFQRTQFLCSVVLYLPAAGDYGSSDMTIIRTYSQTTAGPGLLLRNPSSVNNAPNGQALVLQGRGTGAWSDMATLYRFDNSDRGQWFRVQMWGDTGGGGGAAMNGRTRCRIFRRDSTTPLNTDTDVEYPTNVADAVWQDVRFGNYTYHLTDDVVFMEDISDSTRDVWTFDREIASAWDEGRVGIADEDFDWIYSVQQTATNPVGSKTWTTSALTTTSITQTAPPDNTPQPVSGVTLDNASWLTIPAGAVAAGSMVRLENPTSPASQHSNAYTYPDEYVAYPTSNAVTVIAATDDAGLTLFPALSDNNNSTGVTFEAPTTVVLELQPMTERTPLNINVPVNNATGTSVTCTVSCNGATTNRTLTPSDPLTVVQLANVPTTGLDWRRVSVTVSVT